MLEDKWRTGCDMGIEEEAAQRSAQRRGLKKKGSKGGETVQIITKDLIRNLQ